MSGSSTSNIDPNFFNLIFLVIIPLIAVGGVGLAIYEFVVKRLRLQIDKEFSSSYIDATSNEYIEKYKFKIVNGRFLRKTISLPKTSSKEATVKLYYKPAISFRQELDADYYDFEQNDGKKKIKINVKFLRKQEVEEIYATITSKLDSSDIKKFSCNISASTTSDKIIITNKNMEEIVHYAIEIPPTVPLDKINFFGSKELVEEVHTFSKPGNSPNENLINNKIVVTLRSIPPKTDNSVGVVELPLFLPKN